MPKLQLKWWQHRIIKDNFDFSKGNLFKVVRKNLVHTNNVGVVESVEKWHVHLRMGNGSLVRYNKMSVVPDIKHEQKRKLEKAVMEAVMIENKEKERKPLFGEENVVEMVKKEVLAFSKPEKPNAIGLFISHTGKLYLSSMDRYQVKQDKLLDDAGHIYQDDYLGYMEDEIPLKKPENTGLYPFWSDGMGDEMAVAALDGIRHLFRERNLDKSVVYRNKDDVFFDTAWIDKDKLKRTEKVVIEVYPDGYVVPPEQLLKDARKKHAATASGLSFGVYYIFEGELIERMHINQACHYSIRCTIRHDIGVPKNLTVIQYITNKHYSRYDRKLHHRVEEYLMWVMNDSPWSQHIITKTLEEAVVYGIEVKTNIPSNAMMCTLYALRYPTEYPDIFDLWVKAVDAGVHPTIAFLYGESDGYKVAYSGHHKLLDLTMMGMKEVVDFINHKVGANQTTDYDKSHRYSEVSIHHGNKRCEENFIMTLSNDKRLRPKKVEEKHPVLGAIVREIPAEQLIHEYLTKLKK